MKYRTMLLAVDVNADNASIVDYAFALAERAGATLHTLYACPSGALPGESRSSFYEAQREHAKEQMEQTLAAHQSSASLGDALITVHEPIAAIIQTAAKVAADLIILSTHARKGVERMMIGSVAEGVLDEAQVPVLVVKSP